VSSTPVPDLLAGGEQVKSSIDAVLRTCDQPTSAGHRAFDAACDRFTDSAKEFAKRVLEERIRRSFEGTIDPDGRSTEKLDAKIKHAEAIRDWLTPWNLAFREKSTGLTFQLHGRANRTTSGTFAMMIHGGGRESMQWDRIKAAVLDPELVDITELRRHRQR